MRRGWAGALSFNQVCRDPSKVRRTSATGKLNRPVNRGRMMASRVLLLLKEATDVGGEGWMGPLVLDENRLLA